MCGMRADIQTDITGLGAVLTTTRRMKPTSADLLPKNIYYLHKNEAPSKSHESGIRPVSIFSRVFLDS